MKSLITVINRSQLHQSVASTCAIKQSSILYNYTRSFSAAATPSNDKNVASPPVVSTNSLPDTVVETDEELQEEWRALERRVSNRKPRNIDTRSGRSKRNSSAWDAENA